MGSWCVSNVTDMTEMFRRHYNSFQQSRQSTTMSDFNDDISGWDVSSVTNMAFMFKGASSFNQDISMWNVSSVEDMSYMFDSATSFNQDLSCWNVSSVFDMRRMFGGAEAFNQDLCTWGVRHSPHVNSEDIFDGSGCKFTQNPIWMAGWSFCADQCQYDDQKSLLLYINQVCDQSDTSGVTSYLKRTFIMAMGLLTFVASV